MFDTVKRGDRWDHRGQRGNVCNCLDRGVPTRAGGQEAGYGPPAVQRGSWRLCLRAVGQTVGPVQDSGQVKS